MMQLNEKIFMQSILHIQSGPLNAGAARGVSNLHKALLTAGVKSRVLSTHDYDCSSKSENMNDSTYYQFKGIRISDRIGNLPKKIYINRLNRPFSTGLSGGNIVKTKAYSEADIIHLHWTCGLLPLWSLQQIQKPVVWTLRDMWPLTGGCHYTLGCDNYTKGCGRCPQLNSESPHDLSRAIALWKRKALPKNLLVVGVSQWISKCAQLSSVFRDSEILTIPNCIDFANFKPLPIEFARDKVGYSADKKIILIGSQSLNDYYKGMHLFMEALQMIEEDVVVLAFGNNSLDQGCGSKRVDQLGFLDDESLEVVYSAADVFVVPSIMDALPKAPLESLACGTPVCSFNTGGLRDIITHGYNGYLAFPYQPEDLARGIRWALNNAAFKEEGARMKIRESVRYKFDCAPVAQAYMDLYNRKLSLTVDRS